jgi:hypothetical protein
MVKYEELGVDELICYVQFGRLPHESIMKTIQILGEEIIPKLAKREIEVAATVVHPSTPTDPTYLEGVKGFID